MSSPTADQLANRRALITGASRGIGRATAVCLAAHNMNIALTSRDSEELERTAQLMYEHSQKTPAIIEADLLDPEAPKAIIDGTIAEIGGIDLLVCNAGIALNRPLEESSPEDWDRILNVNAKAPFLLYKHALPALRKSEHPVIVTISSVVGRTGYANQTVYTASKHALAGLTKAFAREVHDEGIRVHLISPGGVATDMIRAVRPDIDEDELIAPEEIAELVAFLAGSRGNGMIDEVAIRRSTSTPWP